MGFDLVHLAILDHHLPSVVVDLIDGHALPVPQLLEAQFFVRMEFADRFDHDTSGDQLSRISFTSRSMIFFEVIPWDSAAKLVMTRWASTDGAMASRSSSEAM